MTGPNSKSAWSGPTPSYLARPGHAVQSPPDQDLGPAQITTAIYLSKRYWSGSRQRRAYRSTQGAPRNLRTHLGPTHQGYGATSPACRKRTRREEQGRLAHLSYGQSKEG